jgi:hypothetical protein
MQPDLIASLWKRSRAKALERHASFYARDLIIALPCVRNNAIFPTGNSAWNLKLLRKVLGSLLNGAFSIQRLAEIQLLAQDRDEAILHGHSKLGIRGDGRRRCD